MVIKNALANIVGGLIAPATALVMMPFYKSAIGLEGLGMVGYSVLLTMVASVFIMGATRSLQRDFVQTDHLSPQRLGQLASAAVTLYLLAGSVAGSIAVGLGFWKQQSIMASTGLSSSEVRACIVIIGAQIGLSFPAGLASSMLLALRDQVIPNFIIASCGVFTAVVSYLVLKGNPSVSMFYFCQVSGLALTVALMLWRCFGQVSQRGKIKSEGSILALARAKWKEHSRVTVQLAATEGLGVLVSQLDRFLITRYLPLSALGAYNLAANPARICLNVTNPVNSVIFPELCRLATDGGRKIVLTEYVCRAFVVLLILAFGLMLLIIPGATGLLTLWLGKGNVPDGCAEVLQVATAGFLTLSLAGLFYNVTVAHGDIKYGIYKNCASLLFLPMVGYYLIHGSDIKGAAWIILLDSVFALMVCGGRAFQRFLDLRSSGAWAKKCVVMAAGWAFACASLSMVHASPWQSIAGGAVSGLLFVLLMMAYCFGISPAKWLGILNAVESKVVVA